VPRFFAPLILLSQIQLSGEVVTLETTVVTASSLEEETDTRPASQSRITAATLQKQGSVTLEDAFQKEPGVSIPLDIAGSDPLVPYLQGGSQGINVRGLQGNRVKLTVDGIPQPDDSTARGFLGTGGAGRIFFDSAVFAQIDLFRSPAPGSGSLAGAVLGETESPFTLLGAPLEGYTLKTSSSVVSSNNSFNQRIAAAWGNGELATSIVYSGRTGHELENNGLAPNSQPSDPSENRHITNPSDNESHATVWKATLRRQGWTLTSTLDYFHSDGFTDLLSNRGPNPFLGNVEDSFSDTEREAFRAAIDFEYEPSISHPYADRYAGKLYYQSTKAHNYNIQDSIKDASPTDRINDHTTKTDSIGLHLSAHKEIENHSLTASYQGSWRDLRAELFRVTNGQPEIKPDLAPSIVWDHSLSLIDEFSHGKWTLTPSLRLNDYRVRPDNTEAFINEAGIPLFGPDGDFLGLAGSAKDYTNFSVSPALHANYVATDSITFFGSYTRGMRNPTAEELNGIFVHSNTNSGRQTVTIPNPDLEEEKSHSFEIGTRYETDGWTTSASAYYNRYENFLQNSPVSGISTDAAGEEVRQTQNIKNAEIYGIELKADYIHPTGWSTGGSFAWSEGNEPNGPLNTVEPWKAVGYFGYSHPDERWGAELAATYVADKRSSDIQGDITPNDSYFLLDLTGYYRINDTVLIRGGVKNILDESYTLWSRANRGSGHAGGVTNERDTQPGINGFLSIELEW